MYMYMCMYIYIHPLQWDFALQTIQLGVPHLWTPEYVYIYIYLPMLIYIYICTELRYTYDENIFIDL